jgi:hypothetical protein
MPTGKLVNRVGSGVLGVMRLRSKFSLSAWGKSRYTTSRVLSYKLYEGSSGKKIILARSLGDIWKMTRCLSIDIILPSKAR